MGLLSGIAGLFSGFTLLAYIDAGTGSMVLQVIIAALAGGALALKIFWRKITRWFKREPGTVTEERATQQDGK